MSMYGGSSYIIKPLAIENKINFFDNFLHYASLNEFPNLNVSKIDHGIKVKINNTGKKDSNIFFHIDKLIERNVFNEEFSLQRIKLYGNIEGLSLMESLTN